QVGNQRNFGNQNGNVVNENIQENVRNVLVNGNKIGCSYTEFLACNPKEYDGKGGAIVLTLWIEKIEYVQEMSGCSVDQKVKYTTGSLMEVFCPSHKMKRSVGWWQQRSQRLYKKVVQISGALTDKAVRNGLIKKVEKRGNVGEPSKDKNGSVPPAIPTMHLEGPVALASTVTARVIWSACPRLNRAQGLEENYPNQVAANNRGQGHGNRWNQARGIEPNELGFRYDIKIAVWQLLKIDKVIKSCMYWLSNHKAEIICHEKVVRIPLLDVKVLRVLGERSKEKARLLVSAKDSDKKQEELLWLEIFPRRSCRDNLRNSKTKVPLDQAHRLGEHRYCL
nr:reverse transcriptase domain-containing protein [Tanacetum cinerariifolium]